MSTVPALRDLVLVGGGHAHVEVLRRFGKRPQPGVRLTLISRETLTPYSGMLPGLISGDYSVDDIHIDLVPLTAFARARFIADELVGLNLDTNRIELAGHPSLRFDLLSLNTGALPAVSGTGGTRVKPIGRFLPQLECIRAAAGAGDTLAVVGGGAGGVELILALRRSLPQGVRLVLVTDRLLPGLPGRAVRGLHRVLNSRSIEVLQGFRVLASSATRLESADGRTLDVDHLLWVTGVAAPGWAHSAGLATDSAGFVRVDSTLNSLSHPQVFASGDIACLEGQERPKAGVFAVRQGKVLAANLRRHLLGKSLRRYRAQRAHLLIVGTGDERAMAVRGALSLYGRWVWLWKRWIDRRFVERFRQLPEPLSASAGRLPRALQSEAPGPMRCAGCGSKLGADLLNRVLVRLPPQPASSLLVGMGDDAALVPVTGAHQLLSVDGFPSMLSDPYRFGRILAHHCLNDLIAMGGRGRHALACATVPLMSEAMMEEDLHAVLLGAVEVLNQHAVPLVGGHSLEGAPLTLTLTLSGDMDGRTPLTRAGLRAGDALILTKALGSGVLLAANLRGRASGRWLEAALVQMEQSNADALAVLRSQDVSALTDVSGFGLLGHLAEMLNASGTGVALAAEQVPRLPGVVELITRGIHSSLHAQNQRVLDRYQFSPAVSREIRVLLVDPQTSGGLLAAVPEANSVSCLQALRDAGFSAAARIGTVTTADWTVTGR